MVRRNSGQGERGLRAWAKSEKNLWEKSLAAETAQERTLENSNI